LNEKNKNKKKIDENDEKENQSLVSRPSLDLMQDKFNNLKAKLRQFNNKTKLGQIINKTKEKLCLEKYLFNLKYDVDLAFVDKLHDKNNHQKYMEIHDKIEQFEMDLNKNIELNYNNKSILFIKDYSVDEKEEKKTFLLIINNTHLEKNTLDRSDEEYFNRDTLNAYFIRKQLNENFKYL